MKSKISMIDISDKSPIKRIAVTSGRIYLSEKSIEEIKHGTLQKGNPLEVGRIAAINAVKMTSILIPLCHQIPISDVSFETNINEDYIEVKVKVVSIAKTGVEMEALVGVTVFLNVIWDMTKYLEKDDDGQYPNTKISNIRVLDKRKIW